MLARRILLGSVISISIILLVVALNASTSAHRLPTAVTCIEKWYLSTTPEVLDRCARIKETADAARMRTAGTLADLQPTVKLPPTYVGTPPSSLPIPAAAQAVEAVDLREFNDAPLRFRGINSMWHIGAMYGATLDDYNLYHIMARPPANGSHAQLVTTLMGNEVPVEHVTKYERLWICPRDVGSLTIVAVTTPVFDEEGPTGIVRFTTSIGQGGTLNMATGQWTFE